MESSAVELLGGLMGGRVVGRGLGGWRGRRARGRADDESVWGGGRTDRGTGMMIIYDRTWPVCQIKLFRDGVGLE